MKKEVRITGPVEAEVSVEVDTLAGGTGVDGAVLSPHSVLQGLVKDISERESFFQSSNAMRYFELSISYCFVKQRAIVVAGLRLRTIFYMELISLSK